MEKARAIIFAVAVSCLLPALPVHAVEPGEMLADPKLETRAREISSGLRCLVCQNQSIDDSEATLAKDLRLLVRERLQAGDTDGQVRDFLVARYGSFVLLKPPLAGGTLLLWGLPLLCLALGGFGIATSLQRRGTSPTPAGLTVAEKAALKRLTTGAAEAGPVLPSLLPDDGATAPDFHAALIQATRRTGHTV